MNVKSVSKLAFLISAFILLVCWESSGSSSMSTENFSNLSAKNTALCNHVSHLVITSGGKWYCITSEYFAIRKEHFKKSFLAQLNNWLTPRNKSPTYSQSLCRLCTMQVTWIIWRRNAFRCFPEQIIYGTASDIKRRTLSENTAPL